MKRVYASVVGAGVGVQIPVLRELHTWYAWMLAGVWPLRVCKSSTVCAPYRYRC